MTRRAGDLWEREFGDSANMLTIAGRTIRLTLIAGFILIFAIAWLVYALASAHSFLPPVALICSVALILGLPRAYAKQRYETAVGRLYQQLDSQRSLAPSTTSRTVSQKDYDLLSKIEVKQSIQSVASSLPQKLSALNDAYSVVLDASVIAFLTELKHSDPDAAFAIRETVDSLQTNHLPPDAQPVVDAPAEFTFESEQRFRIRCRADDERGRVEVLAIAPLEAGAAAHG